MVFCRKSMLGILALAVTGVCSASTISTTGTFTFDSDLSVISFTVLTPSEIIVTSFGYGGGTNGQGTDIAAGGLAPDLALFDPNGVNVVQDTAGGNAVPGSGCTNGTNPDPNTHLCLDSTLFFLTSVPGTYTVVLSEQNVGNDPPQFPDVFTGPSSYPLPPGTDVTTPPFQDVFGNQRNGNFAFDINVSSTPEPGTILGVFLGICAMASRKRRAAR
jgi:hypothetical protein